MLISYKERIYSGFSFKEKAIRNSDQSAALFSFSFICCAVMRTKKEKQLLCFTFYMKY